MLRLFTAIALPRDLKDRLALMQGGVPGAYWVAPENFHLTLAFHGEVDDDTAEALDEALSGLSAAPFILAPRGIGTFKKGDKSTALWAGVEKSDALYALQEKACHAFDRHRIHYEKRKFTPHITLARLKHADESRLAAFVQEHNLFHAPSFTVDSIALYRSHPTKNGSRYEVLQEYAF